MTSIRADINKDTDMISVSAPLSNPTYPLFRSIGSETIKVTAGADTTEWQVERGIGDTQAAFHGKGAALIADTTPYGAGGDPGEQNVYVQPTDPGAVGAARLWIDNTFDPPRWWRRKADDTGWWPYAGSDSVAPEDVDQDADASDSATALFLTALATANKTASSINGQATSQNSAATEGTGDAVTGQASLAVSGDARSNMDASTTTGDASITLRAERDRDGTPDVASLRIESTATGLAFIMTGLPTVDPEVVGALWNDAGILTVSAG